MPIGFYTSLAFQPAQPASLRVSPRRSALSAAKSRQAGGSLGRLFRAAKRRLSLSPLRVQPTERKDTTPRRQEAPRPVRRLHAIRFDREIDYCVREDSWRSLRHGVECRAALATAR